MHVCVCVCIFACMSMAHYVREISIIFVEMALPQMYKTRVRVHNNIYEPVLTADEFEDVRQKGLQSDIVNIFLLRDVISTVIGKFKHPVEILSVTPVSSCVSGGGDQPQAMEFEVTIY